MRSQARAYGISLGIHILVFSFLLAVGLVTPRQRAVVLNFSIEGSAKSEQQAVAPSRRNKTLAQTQKTVMPATKDEQAVPVRKERIEADSQPVTQQPMMARDESGASDAAARAGYLSSHFVNIRDKILRNLNYPAIARRMGWAGKVTVAFTVCMDGSVEELSVLESSGYPVLDKYALETIRKSCPLPRPPVKTALIMPVLYRLE